MGIKKVKRPIKWLMAAIANIIMHLTTKKNILKEENNKKVR